MASAANLTISISWIIFIVYWFISARGIKTASQQKSFSSSLSYRIPAFFGGILLWYPALPNPWNLALTPRTDSARVAAEIVCVCGLFVALWARRTLAGNWSSNVTFKEGHELVKSGPYRFARHPIYTGILLMSLGSALEVGRLRCWLGVLLFGISFWIKLKQEETLMLRYFPDQYPSYRKQVKALVPFVI